MQHEIYKSRSSITDKNEVQIKNGKTGPCESNEIFAVDGCESRNGKKRIGKMKALE